MYYLGENYKLLKVDENSTKQRCAAHIVQCCHQYCLVFMFIFLLQRVYSTLGNLKYIPDHGGNRTYDLWNVRPMFWQLSYAFRIVSLPLIYINSILRTVPNEGPAEKAARSGRFKYVIFRN